VQETGLIECTSEVGEFMIAASPSSLHLSFQSQDLNRKDMICSPETHCNSSRIFVNLVIMSFACFLKCHNRSLCRALSIMQNLLSFRSSKCKDQSRQERFYNYFVCLESTGSSETRNRMRRRRRQRPEQLHSRRSHYDDGSKCSSRRRP